MFRKFSPLLPAFAVLLAVMIIASCKKNDNPFQPQLPDLQTKVTASVNGMVLDENNQVVQGATVKVGTQTATTDQYGYFSFSNVEVVKTAAVVTVTHSGYFPGLRTFIAEQGKTTEVRIKLLPKTVLGSIDASTGGSVSNAEGLTIALPADGVEKADGSAYSGPVTVAARWINPASDDISFTMPGDLRALNSSGEIRTLLTYGMAAVELTGSGGELLQVADGKTSTLTMPLPASLQSASPATIPLWHFDEVKGLWVEEGFATKIGNSYVGEVSHYSFWNCDVPQQYVQLNLTLLDPDGNPVPNARVKLTMVNSPHTSTNGYTNNSGYVIGAVPANTDLVMEVYAGFGCSNVVYTQNIPGSSTNISLGNITLPAAQSAQLSGTVVDCNMQPVTNGIVVVTVSGFPYVYQTSNTGTFNFSMPMCSTTVTVTIVAEDRNAMQQSGSTTHILNAGSNAIGTIQACGVSTSQYMNFTVDGTPYSFTAPADSIYMAGTGTNQAFTVGAFQTPSGGNWASLIINNTGIGVGTSQEALYFNTSVINDSTEMNTTQFVNITEYGNVGEFISGSFNLTLTGMPPANPTYTVVGNFRVRRAW